MDPFGGGSYAAGRLSTVSYTVEDTEVGYTGLTGMSAYNQQGQVTKKWLKAHKSGKEGTWR